MSEKIFTKRRSLLGEHFSKKKLDSFKEKMLKSRILKTENHIMLYFLANIIKSVAKFHKIVFNSPSQHYIDPPHRNMWRHVQWGDTKSCTIHVSIVLRS